jgi:hypothetical protein
MGVALLLGATLAAGIFAWTIRRSRATSIRQAYVGRWTFVSGTAKAGPGFPLSAKTAPDGSSEQPLQGKSSIVEERDGTLWYGGDDQSNCWYRLRVTGDRAEAVPTTLDCAMKGAATNATTRVTVVGLSMAIDKADGQARAHISGESRFLVDVNGTQRDIDISYDGIAVRDPRPKD